MSRSVLVVSGAMGLVLVGMSAAALAREELDHKVTSPPGVAVGVVVSVPAASSGAGTEPANAADGAAATDVGGSASKVSPAGSRSLVLYRQPCLRRRVGGAWGPTLSFCARARQGRTARTPSPADVARVLADRAAARAPAPNVHAAPSAIGVTGLSSYFWVDRAAPIRASARVRAVVVTAEARPVRYVWSFGDGAGRVTTGPGRSWSVHRPGSNAHVYEASGIYRLRVERVWEARWRVGSSAWRPLGSFSTSAARTYPVRAVVAMLVRRR